MNHVEIACLGREVWFTLRNGNGEMLQEEHVRTTRGYVVRRIVIDVTDTHDLRVEMLDQPNDGNAGECRYADRLTYDECLGLVATLTRMGREQHPGLKWLRTEDQWQAYNNRLTGMRARNREEA